MVIYILSAVIILLSILNWILGEKLYKEPKSTSYFDNVTSISIPKEKYIQAEPRYVVKISILTGIMIGLYMAYASVFKSNGFIIAVMVFLLLSMYLFELTRTITLKDSTLVYSRFLSKKKEINVNEIRGMYIYSYTKKFLNQHAYTTKLVITKKDGEKIKLALSSLDNRAVLNMMKENFGVNNNKMFIAKGQK